MWGDEMLEFLLQKIKSSKWMSVSLLLGGILLFSIVAAIPMYADAVLQSVMTSSLEDIQADGSTWAGSIHTEYAARVGSSYKIVPDVAEYAERLPYEYGTDVIAQSSTRKTFTFHFSSEGARTQLLQSRQGAVCVKTNLEDHVTIIRGEMFSEEPEEDGVLQVIVNARTYAKQDLMVGEVYTFDSLSDENGNPLRFRVTGVFKLAKESDPYWYENPETYGDVLWAAPEAFDCIFGDNYKSRFSMTFYWDSVVDTAQMNVASSGKYLQTTIRTREAVEELRGKVTAAFEGTLAVFETKTKELNTILWLLLVPILAMLALFLFMVCRQILEQEKPTISVLKSRGFSRGKIVGLYAIQSTMLGAAAAVIGLPMGYFVCRVIGSSDGFMNLVSRTALPVRFAPRALLFVAVALLAYVAMMTIPAIFYSAQSIVSQKREGNMSGKVTGAAMGASGAAICVGLYGLYAFYNQKDAVIAGVAEVDPLLFLAASLFLLGAGAMVALGLPYLFRLVFRLGKKLWKAPAYAALLRSQRATTDQRFLMIFLVLTIAVGIFNATAARTVNRNKKDNLYYANGADVVLLQEWKDNSGEVALDRAASVMTGKKTSDTILYDVPDYTPFTVLNEENENVSVTRVLNSAAYYAKETQTRVLGIETAEFGRTAWMRDGLLPIHFYRFLNALASDPNGVLLSENYKDLGYRLGGAIDVKNENGVEFTGVIYGFFSYWPTYYDRSVSVDSFGTEKITDEYLVVGNLGQMQAVWGMEPYEIWISTDDTDLVYDFVEREGIRLVSFIDTQADLVDAKNEPVLQGMNGILTVGFILVLVVCMVGFLIFWILSIRSRTLQFGVFRAIGMPMTDLLRMLTVEQAMISLTSVAAGAGIGILASRLYVPLIQMSFSAGRISLPMEIVAEGADYARLFGVFGFILALCLAILVWQVKRIRIAQALKLGED